MRSLQWILLAWWMPNRSASFTGLAHTHRNPRPIPNLRVAKGEGDKIPFPLHDGTSWKLTNDFHTFLNQVTIQSLIFLMNSLRDRNTALWLEDFSQPILRSRDKEGDHDSSHQTLSNMASAMSDALRETQMERPIRLLTYHGIGAINTTLFPTWDSYFDQLLQAPQEVFTIESSRPNVPTYEMEINPASLCSRLISIREQIAFEFVNDLNVLAEMSNAMVQSYLDQAEANEPLQLETPNLLFLERSVHEDYQPSPLRKGNFDLLLTLSTQEAIHRLLNQRDSQCTEDRHTQPSLDRSSHIFLRNFYTERIGTHFTGSNFYGRANDFVGGLLQASPSLIQLQDEESGLVDPAQVASRILQERERVADEWIELAMDAPQMHTLIKRLQLDRLMGITSERQIESEFE